MYLLVSFILLLFCLNIYAKVCAINENLDDQTALRLFEQDCIEKPYKTQNGLRKSILQKNLDLVRKHNAKFKERKELFKIGLNKFSDKTENELKVLFGLIEIPQNVTYQTFSKRQVAQKLQLLNFGENLDLRKTGCIREVGDQDTCASCYAWAAAYLADACRCLQCHTILEYSSIQDIIDCSFTFGNYGCAGGNIKNAIGFTKNYASARQDDYPYKGKTGMCFRISNSIINKNLLKYVEIAKVNETAMLEIIKVYRQPLAVGIKANIPELIYYSGGIISGNICHINESELDHAVLIIGYGTDLVTGKPYWLCQNFWSKDWGEDGLFRVEMGSNCIGISYIPSFAIFGC